MFGFQSNKTEITGQLPRDVITEAGPVVTIHDGPDDSFQIQSPECNWEVFFFAKSDRDPVDRYILIDTAQREVSGDCGPC